MKKMVTERGRLREAEKKFREDALKTKAIRESITKKLEKEGLNPSKEKRLILLGEMITKAMQEEDKTRVIELQRAFNDLLKMRKEQEERQKIELKKPIVIVSETRNEIKKIENDFKIKLTTKRNKPVKKAEKLR